MAYQVNLPVFEGPMDLLLHLIEKNEVDIYNIPIALITEQYLLYLAQAGEVDLELTSEFLVMACTLLAIKARMLLPRPAAESGNEEEESSDPREELVNKLLEYKEFKEKADLLKQKETEQSQVYWREVDEAQLYKMFPPDNPIGNLSMTDLLSAYKQILRKIEKKREFFAIPREEMTIEQKIEEILYQLEQQGDGLPFGELFSDAVTRSEVIVTFLALLELARLELVYVHQSQPFAEIYIYQKKGGQEFAHAIS